MIDGIKTTRKSCKCALCDNDVKSSEDGWIFNKFNLCYHCIDKIFEDYFNFLFFFYELIKKKVIKWSIG